MKHFISGDRVAWDTETTGRLVHRGARPYAFTFANEEGHKKAFTFPVDLRTRRVDYGADRKGYREIERLLADPKVEKIGFNAKFDVRMCRAAGLEVKGRLVDVMVAAKVARSDEMAYGLKPLAKKYVRIDDADLKALQSAVTKLLARCLRLGCKPPGDAAGCYWLCQHAEWIMVESTKMLKTWQSVGSARKEKMLDDARAVAATIRDLDVEYGTLDAERTMVLWLMYEEVLEQSDLTSVFEEEMGLMPVVMAVEDRGVQLDVDWIRRGRDSVSAVVASTEPKILALAGPTFNINSYPDRVDYFINKLGLEPVGLTDKGNPAIDKVFHERYADEAPMCRLLVEHDRAYKARGYYDDYLSEMEDDGVVHCSFDQIGTKTLRFACRDPNFQNVPKRGRCRHCRKELDINARTIRGFSVWCKTCAAWRRLDPLICVRRPFCPREGHLWVLADYKQIEARLFADAAGEDVLLAAFAAGRDPYEELASAVLGETGINIGRDIAKHVFLGKIYGLGVGKMALTIRRMGGGEVDEGGAKTVLQAFDATFPKSRVYMKAREREAASNGYVTNHYGQRVYIDQRFCYRGTNAVIQSDAARLMKRAMVKAHEWLETLDAGHLVLTIHDELVFEVPDDGRAPKTARSLGRLMADNGGAFEVATPVDLSVVRRTWLLKETLAC